MTAGKEMVQSRGSTLIEYDNFERNQYAEHGRAKGLSQRHEPFVHQKPLSVSRIKSFITVSIDKLMFDNNDGICICQGEDDYLTTILEGSPEQRALALKNMLVAKALRDQELSWVQSPRS